MSKLVADNLRAPTAGVEVPTQYVVHGSAKSLISFNGTGTVAINASFNISSLTDNAVGNYTANLTSSMSSANHTPPCSTNGNGSGGIPYAGVSNKAAGSVTMQTTNATVTVDNSMNNVAVFGTLA